MAWVPTNRHVRLLLCIDRGVNDPTFSSGRIRVRAWDTTAAGPRADVHHSIALRRVGWPEGD